MVIALKRDPHEYLLSVDEKDSWEFPKQMDWHAEYRAIRALLPELETAIARQLVMGSESDIQDASFLTNVSFAEDHRAVRAFREDGVYPFFTIRFSNFGRMFTIWSSDWPQVMETHKLDRAVAFLEAREYRYIPAEVLDRPYDGVNDSTRLGTQYTWRRRYFDYL